MVGMEDGKQGLVQDVEDLSSVLYTSQLMRNSRQPRDVLHSLHWAILKEQRQRSITNLTRLCGSRQMRNVKSGCIYIMRWQLESISDRG